LLKKGPNGPFFHISGVFLQKRRFSQSTLEVNDRETTAKIEITAVRRENDVKFAITASAVVAAVISSYVAYIQFKKNII